MTDGNLREPTWGENRHPHDIRNDTVGHAKAPTPAADASSGPLFDERETLFTHDKGVVLGRPFHTNDFGDIDVYLFDDRYLPASLCYFAVRVTVEAGMAVGYFWKAYHGPVECFPGLSGGDLQEAFEMALAHYSARLERAGL